METKISTYKAESGHWYDGKTGMPTYTIIGKNGKERNTTLRDARQLDLVPSVTTILHETAKPGLDNWKQNQVLMAALTLPKIENENEQEYISRIKEDAKQQAIKAAEKGTEIHKWIQQGFEGVEFLTDTAMYRYYLLASQILDLECGTQKWIPEQSFSTGKYGGKIDLHCYDYLFDIKTKENINDVKLWDEHFMQLAAYQNGIKHQGKAGIIFVSTTELEAKIEWAKPEQLTRGMNMFNSLVSYWYAKTGLLKGGDA